MRDDREYMHNSTFKRPRKGLNKVNYKRRERLRLKQFGEPIDGQTKGDWIRGMVDAITGEWGTEDWPIEAAHVGSPDPDERRAGNNTRGNGADERFILPLRKDTHFEFDNLDEATFERRHGVTKTWCREIAASLHDEWVAMHPSPDSGVPTDLDGEEDAGRESEGR